MHRSSRLMLRARQFAVALAGFVVASLPAASQEAPARFDGPLSLARAVELALRENRLLRAMAADETAAREDQRAARSMLKPQASLNTTLAASSMESIVSGSPDVAPANALVVPRKPYASQNVTIMAPLHTGGRLEGIASAAADRASAAREETRSVRIEVALATREAYFQALFAKESIRTADARVAASRALVASSKALHETGKGLAAAVARAEAEAASAEAMRTSALNDWAKAELDLKRTMGVHLESAFELTDELSFAPVLGSLADRLVTSKTSRPELSAARYRVREADSLLGAARGLLRPQVYAALMGDVFAPGEMGRHSSGTIAVTIGLPLFDGGLRRSEAARQAALRERVAHELRDLELRAEAEVRQAWLDAETASRNILSARVAVRAAETAHDVAVIRVQNQKAILVEQLDALAALVQARTDLARALYDHAVAAARLRRATGME